MSCHMQDFPETVDEFMEQYKMIDRKEVYSNGTEYVPIFRMKQWFEHEKAKRTAKVDVDGGDYYCGVCAQELPASYRYCPTCGARLEWK